MARTLCVNHVAKNNNKQSQQQLQQANISPYFSNEQINVDNIVIGNGSEMSIRENNDQNDQSEKPLLYTEDYEDEVQDEINNSVPRIIHQNNTFVDSEGVVMIDGLNQEFQGNAEGQKQDLSQVNEFINNQNNGTLPLAQQSTLSSQPGQNINQSNNTQSLTSQLKIFQKAQQKEMEMMTQYTKATETKSFNRYKKDILNPLKNILDKSNQLHQQIQNEKKFKNMTQQQQQQENSIETVNRPNKPSAYQNMKTTGNNFFKGQNYEILSNNTSINLGNRKRCQTSQQMNRRNMSQTNQVKQTQYTNHQDTHSGQNSSNNMFTGMVASQSFTNNVKSVNHTVNRQMNQIYSQTNAPSRIGGGQPSNILNHNPLIHGSQSTFEQYDFMRNNYDYKDNYKHVKKVFRNSNHQFSASQDIFPLPKYSESAYFQEKLFKKKPKTQEEIAKAKSPNKNTVLKNHQLIVQHKNQLQLLKKMKNNQSSMNQYSQINDEYTMSNTQYHSSNQTHTNTNHNTNNHNTIVHNNQITVSAFNNNQTQKTDQQQSGTDEPISQRQTIRESIKQTTNRESVTRFQTNQTQDYIQGTVQQDQEQNIDLNQVNKNTSIPESTQYQFITNIGDKNDPKDYSHNNTFKQPFVSIVSSNKQEPIRLSSPDIQEQKEQSSHLTHYGQFQYLDCDDHRRILFSKGSMDNRGKLLTQGEIDYMSGCLDIQRVPIEPYDKFNDGCIQMYSREAKDCNQIFDREDCALENVPPCVFYPFNKLKGQVMPLEAFKNEMMQLTNHSSEYFQDLMFKMNEDEMRKIIEFLKKRNTKENIQNLKDEYDSILSQLTGKKRPVSMYQVLKQIRDQNQDDSEDDNKQPDGNSRNAVKQLQSTNKSNKKGGAIDSKSQIKSAHMTSDNNRTHRNNKQAYQTTDARIKKGDKSSNFVVNQSPTSSKSGIKKKILSSNAFSIGYQKSENEIFSEGQKSKNNNSKLQVQTPSGSNPQGQSSNFKSGGSPRGGQKSSRKHKDKHRKRGRRPKQQKTLGIELKEAHIYIDKEKKKFKLLTNFLNCYKDKLMLNQKVDDTEEIMMNAQQMREAFGSTQNNLDLQIDYDLYQKIKFEESGKDKESSKNKTFFIYPSNKSASQNSHIKKKPGQVVKERIQSYIDKKRKFQQIQYMKATEKNDTYEQMQDMKKRDKQQISSFGKILQLKQSQLKNDTKRIEKTMGQTKSFIHGVQERRRREQEDLFIKEQIKEIRDNQYNFSKKDNNKASSGSGIVNHYNDFTNSISGGANQNGSMHRDHLGGQVKVNTRSSVSTHQLKNGYDSQNNTMNQQQYLNIKESKALSQNSWNRHQSIGQQLTQPTMVDNNQNYSNNDPNDMYSLHLQQLKNVVRRNVNMRNHGKYNSILQAKNRAMFSMGGTRDSIQSGQHNKFIGNRNSAQHQGINFYRSNGSQPTNINVNNNQNNQGRP